MSDEGLECVPIRDEADIVVARQRGRTLAEHAGFRGTDSTIIATVISELARNIVDYASRGELCYGLEQGSTSAIIIVARDSGPGIEDLATAMTDGYSTGGGLGLGLPGVRRLMDEFEIESSPGKGTVVWTRKVLRS